MYQRIKKLISESQIKRIYPATDLAEKKADFDNAVKKIISDGRKFLLIIGPCSADNSNAVLKYCERLKKIADSVKDKIFIIPRVYTTKPRSEADAYRGMLHSPNAIDADFNGGIKNARKLMIDVATNFGFFVADEMLYPSLYQYFDDVISYVTIGARSSENQFHRMFASGLKVPVGIKNPMNGNMTSLIQAICTAKSTNSFALNGYEVRTDGNIFAHGILRGFTDEKGEMHQNYSINDIKTYIEKCREHNISSEVIIDCNHSNSGKNCFNEPKVAECVINSLSDDDIKRSVRGLMIESYLLDGRQDRSVEFGKSLTDSCLGIEKTEALIYSIAEKL